MNREWHLANKMPKNPTQDQRIAWHAEHMRNCDCRAPSPEMIKEIKRHGL